MNNYYTLVPLDHNSYSVAWLFDWLSALAVCLQLFQSKGQVGLYNNCKQCNVRLHGAI